MGIFSMITGKISGRSVLFTIRTWLFSPQEKKNADIINIHKMFGCPSFVAVCAVKAMHIKNNKTIVFSDFIIQVLIGLYDVEKQVLKVSHFNASEMHGISMILQQNVTLCSFSKIIPFCIFAVSYQCAEHLRMAVVFYHFNIV